MVGLRGFAAVAAFVTSSVAASSLPTVDLGYAVHQATINDTGFGYYNFSNIRYAAPPTGENRFSWPLPITGKNRTVNDGQQASICPQASPLWELQAEKFLAQYLTGVPIANITASLTNSSINTANVPIADLIALIPKPDPRTTEDCLFLDVMVPKSIFAAKKRKRNNKGAPVLVWIYGGGFTGGSKVASGSPATLLARSQENGGDGVIFVAMNYRLGLFGWMSGPTFQQNATANVGLLDQRYALQWVQSNIHLFGGDPSRVTVMGESAGGASIMHQITAYGGLKGGSPFQQAILQSPGFLPVPSVYQQETVFQEVLAYASAITQSPVTSLSALRKLNTTELYLINYAIVGLSPYSSFTFGPVVDGKITPQLPGLLLLHGQFDHSIKVMLGHNSNEGLLFTNPFVQNDTAFAAYILASQPTASTKALQYFTETLYPPIFNSSYGYVDQIGRSSLAISELSFTCNTRYLDLAFQNKTYSYYYTVPPGLHGQDVPYTFFNGDTTTSDDGMPVNATVATDLQDYITQFAMTGTPNEKGVPYFPVYGTNSSTQVLGLKGLGTQVVDTTANARCDWLQKALYA